jgi:hypothetical protein
MTCRKIVSHFDWQVKKAVSTNNKSSQVRLNFAPKVDEITDLNELNLAKIVFLQS